MESKELLPVGSRTITVKGTRGESKTIAFAGVQWSELKKVLQQSGFSLDNMKAVEAYRRTTLEAPTALVPEVDFVLFLMPVKSASGAKAKAEARKRGDINADVKEYIDRDGDRAKEFFKGDKPSYTQQTGEELEKLLLKYAKKAPVKQAKVKETSEKHPKAEAKGKVAKGKGEKIASVVGSVEAKAKVSTTPLETKEEMEKRLDTEMRELGREIPGVRF